MRKVINPEYTFLEKFVDELPFGRFESSGDILHDGRNTIKQFEVDGEQVVVKRFKRPNIINQFAYALIRGSKAKRGYHNAFKLEHLGVATPTPIGYVDLFEGLRIIDSYLVTEYTDFAPIKDLENEDKVNQLVAIEEFMKFTVELHEKGVRHDDFNDSNVRYKRMDDGEVEFKLIDINRMRFGPMSRRECITNMKRMCSNHAITYHMSTRYAELRGWNPYKVMAALALSRTVFERQRSKRQQLKEDAVKWYKGASERG